MRIRDAACWAGFCALVSACSLGSDPELSTTPDASDSGGSPGSSGGSGGRTSGGSPGNSGGSGGVEPQSGGAPSTGGVASGGADPGVLDGGDGGDGGEGGSPVGDGGVSLDGTGVIGERCAPEGAFACGGHGSPVQITCTRGSWAASGPGCSTGLLCDTSEANRGRCAVIVPECAGKKGGDSFCRNLERVECGPDLVSTRTAETCDFLCTAGECSGVCKPLAKDCGGGAGNGKTPRTCQPDGTWLDAATCAATCAASTGECVAATCTDRTKNGTESDIDCGGSCGPTCTVPLTCNANTDCVLPASGKCTSGRCAAALCNDGVKNGTETDQDCGGSCASKCAVAKKCGGDVDCASGVCVSGTCATCRPNTKRCSSGGVQTCSANGAAWSAVVACSSSEVCNAGACVVPPSCQGLASNCGATANESCCVSPTVPGGSAKRLDLDIDGSTTAGWDTTVSTFRLDKYDVTVGRFRKFLGAYRPNMHAAGAGKNPNNATDPGWSTSWNATLPPNAEELTYLLPCEPTASWSTTPGAKETYPISCVDWYMAASFCIWDGGRLPTIAEWNYAASGGSEQRFYPWSNPPSSTTIDCSYANAAVAADGKPCTSPPDGAPLAVGMKPAGNGKWGQSDLAGNVYQWVYDWVVDPFPQPCVNCAKTDTGTHRILQGGDFGAPGDYLQVRGRGALPPGERGAVIGFRCARAF